MSQSGFSPIIIVLLVLLVAGLVGGAYYFGTQQNNSFQNQPTPVYTPLPQTSVAPTLNPTPRSTASGSAQTKGAGVKEIKYTLPSGWTAEISGQTLSFRAGGGGFLTVSVHNYDGQSRREYFCQVIDYCGDSATFKDFQIGNISGYRADGLDNSGGGPEYFGAKGDTFYTLTSYNAPNDTASGTKLQQLMNSLMF